MSGHLEVRAELQRLGRLLHVPIGELAYLETLAAEELRELRLAVTDVLYAPNGMLERIALATKLVPAGVAATIGERVFGPVIVARLAPLVEIDRAVEMAGRLSVSFLADVGAVIDPRRVEAILARIPPERIAEVSAELVARNEFVALGSYVAALPDPSLRAALDRTDPASLLQEALVAEHKDQLPRVFRLAGEEKLKATFAAAPGLGLETEARELAGHLSAEQRALVGP